MANATPLAPCLGHDRARLRRFRHRDRSRPGRCSHGRHARHALARGAPVAAGRADHRALRPQRPHHRPGARRHRPRRRGQRADTRRRSRQATVAIEDKRFYSHHGIDFISRGARRPRRPARRPRRAGRQHDHRAVHQERLPGQRGRAGAQDPRGRARLAARGRLEQGPDPHRLPEHRLLRLGRLRRRGRRADLLPQARLAARPARVRPAGGAAAHAQRLLAGHRPGRRPGAPQPRAAADAAAGATSRARAGRGGRGHQARRVRPAAEPHRGARRPTSCST